MTNIPKNAAELTAEEAELANGGAPRKSAQYYVVRKGDTLTMIAHRFGTTVQRLLSLNPQIVDPEKLFAGDRIRVK